CSRETPNRNHRRPRMEANPRRGSPAQRGGRGVGGGNPNLRASRSGSESTHGKPTTNSHSAGENQGGEEVNSPFALFLCFAGLLLWPALAVAVVFWIYGHPF